MRLRRYCTPKALFVSYLLLVLIFRIFMVSDFRVFAGFTGGPDDDLMVRDASSLIAHDWLGPFDKYTMAKGITFPVYLTVMNKFGIPFLLSNVFLEFAACVTFVMVMRKLIPNRFWLAVLYTILMFNPMATYYWTFNRVYRDSIYSYLVIFLFSCIISLFLNRYGSLLKTVWLSACSGFFLAAVWLAREDSPWVLPFVIAALLITALGICFNKKAAQKIKRLLALALVPGVLILSILLVSIINDHEYGYFGTNEFTSGNLPLLIKELSIIKPDVWNPRVPIPKSTREKAYAVSPTFTKIKGQLENNHTMRIEKGNPTCDIFVWILLDSVQNAGMKSASSTQKFYRQSAEEIQKAINEGKLQTRGGYMTIFESPWDNRYISPLFKALGETVHMTVFMEDHLHQKLGAANVPSTGPVNQIRTLERVTNNLAYNPAEPIPPQQKVDFFNKLASVYKFLNPAATVLAVAAYLYIFVRFLISIRTKKYIFFSEWIILTGLWMSYLVRMLLLSYSDVGTNFMLYPMYLAPGYWLIVMFNFSSLFIAGRSLWEIGQNHFRFGNIKHKDIKNEYNSTYGEFD